MIEYGLIDLLVDAAILGDWHWRRTDPATHIGSWSSKEIDDMVGATLRKMQEPAGLPGRVDPARDERIAAFKRRLGGAAYKRVLDDAARVSDIVNEAAKGLKPEQLKLLEESHGVRDLLRDYVTMANHISHKDFDNPKLAKAFGETLPELHERISTYARTRIDHGSFHELLEHCIKDETLLDAARDAHSQAGNLRMVPQAYTAAFSSWKNFKASLGCAAFIKNETHIEDHRSGSRSFMFYSGGLLAADSAVHLLRPQLNDREAHNKEKGHNHPNRSFTYNVCEGLLGMGMLIGAIMAAGRRIPLR